LEGKESFVEDCELHHGVHRL